MEWMGILTCGSEESWGQQLEGRTQPRTLQTPQHMMDLGCLHWSLLSVKSEIFGIEGSIKTGFIIVLSLNTKYYGKNIANIFNLVKDLRFFLNS